MALNILIVDDSDVIRAMIAKTLRLSQLPVGDVFEACNGKEALGLLETEWVDLVLADINMPIMSGAEMIATMRRKDSTAAIPVVVVSSEGATARMHELTSTGVAAWIRKPFTPEEIRDVVSNLTDAWNRSLEHAELLDHAFGLVMGQFAMCFSEPADGSLPDPGDSLVQGSIDFTGASCGTLTLAAPAALCSEWAANVLGIDSDVRTALDAGPDTLAEALNMVAGRVATGLHADAATDLLPPVVRRLDRADWERLASKGTARRYLVEDQPVIATLAVRPGLRAS